MKFGINTNTANTSTKRFSEIKGSEKIMSRLAASSTSAIDLNARIEAYQKAFSNLDGLYETRKFNGTSGLQNLGGLNPQQYVDVTVTAMVKSIAGFLTIERGLDAPRAILPFVNLVTAGNDGYGPNLDNPTPADLASGRQGEPTYVSRNIGPDATKSGLTFPNSPSLGQYAGSQWVNAVKSAQNVLTFNATATDTIEYLDANGAFVPSSLKLTVSEYDPATGKLKDSFQLTDNGQGEILAPAGRVLSGSINYRNGNIKVKLAQAMTTDFKYTLDVAYDTPRRPINRVKGDLDYYELTTYPNSILAESNMINNLVAQKSMGIDMNQVLKKKVMEEYLKMINKTTVDTLTGGYMGNTLPIDLSAYSIKHNGYESYLHLFAHGLVQVNNELTSKSWKSVETSAYIVGVRVAEIFQACTIMNTFVPNKESGYIEDLIGYYNGIPVIKSYRVGDTEGYAIHKTSDGLMAPMARGIFLPVNDLPEVGNFNNPTQSASGIFSYEGVKFLTSELVQKFEVTLPEGINTIATGANKAEILNGWAAITRDV